MEGRGEENSAIDGFSKLPEAIIHHIMSILPPKDATKMSILSKTFSSAWSSFPIINFDYQLFNVRNIDLFLDYVVDALQHRRGLNSCLEKLSFSADLYGFEHDSRVQRVIDFALSNNVKELMLDTQMSPSTPRYNLPTTIFSAKSITTLKLKGFKCVCKDLIFTASPWIENLSLIDCNFKTITLASNAAKLKAVQIENCESKLNFSSSTRTDLKHLKLTSDGVPSRWIKQNFSEFRYLESLKLRGISKCKKNIKFHLEYLKTLELENAMFNRVEVEAPNLVSFYYSSADLVRSPSDIDISRSTNLKHLRYHCNSLPKRWFHRHNHEFFEFGSLESLELLRCIKLKKIKFHLKCLKILKLLYCLELAEVEIEAPNLVTFEYKGDFHGGAPKVTFTSEAKPEIMTEVQDNIQYPRCFQNLRNFLACFAQHCKTLTMDYSSIDGDYERLNICTKELRQTLGSPLYDIKHLKVQVMWLEKRSLVELVDILLWLAPHLNTISIILETKVKSMKFQYKHGNTESWQHDLKEVMMENLDDDERTILQNYFLKL